MPRILIELALCAYLMLPCAAWAQARLRDPLDYPLRQYAFILAITTLAGAVSWYSKVKRGEIPPWSINHLVGELATSALAGLLTFWLCEWARFDPLLTASLAGIAGHMGTRAITALENWAIQRAESKGRM